MRPIKKYLPNTLTCCNLLTGCIAISFGFHGNLKVAFIFIILGVLFDFLSSLTIYLFNASSKFVKELDSLADIITFGVAPSVMVFYHLKQLICPTFLEPIGGILPYSAFLIAAASALRLAKFNLDERPKNTFIGLPTLANALFWGGILMLQSNYENSPAFYLFMLFLVFVSSSLLVSGIPMFSLKFKTINWKENRFCLFFLATAVLLLFILSLPAFAIIVTWYVILSIIQK